MKQEEEAVRKINAGHNLFNIISSVAGIFISGNTDISWSSVKDWLYIESDISDC